MVEAASQLDLQIFDDTSRNSNVLLPSARKKPIREQKPKIYIYLISNLAIFSTMTRWIYNEFSDGLAILIIAIFYTILYGRKEIIKGKYYFDENGLVLPYLWFTRKKIKFENILNITDDTITDTETNQSYAAIRIFLDTKMIKFNYTGMQTSNILLTTMDYDSMDLNRFADLLTKEKQKTTSSPNTLAQRLTDQVNRAWQYRWFSIFLNIFDSSTEFLLYLILIELLIFGFSGQLLIMTLSQILLPIYIIFLLILQILNKPQAIIGIRPHELGPLIYDEEEMMTTVRFIIICNPFTIDLIDCEILYSEGDIKQVGKLNQIHPESISKGQLAYAVAQIYGNHTKASGAIIKFSYKEKSKTDVVYEVPITWG